MLKLDAATSFTLYSDRQATTEVPLRFLCCVSRAGGLVGRGPTMVYFILRGVEVFGVKSVIPLYLNIVSKLHREFKGKIQRKIITVLFSYM